MVKRRLLIIGIGCMVMMLAAGAVMAQETEGTRTTVVREAVESWTLIQMWHMGGFVMYPLGLLSVGMVGLTIFGFLITREQKMIHLEMVPPLQEYFRRLDLKAAGSLCMENPSIMTNTLHAGLLRITDESLEISAVEKAMEEAAVEEHTSGLKSINYLSVIGAIAPMLGLLGTVLGMIGAFQTIAVGGMGDPTAFADDIGKAMVTTAFGLMVGIPAMFFYFFIKARFVSNMSRVGRVLGTMTHELDAAFQRLHKGDLEQVLLAVPEGKAATVPADA